MFWVKSCKESRCVKIKICVVGLGYIGLPTALMLAAHGNDIVGVDNDHELVEKLCQRTVTFQEEGLLALLKSAQEKGIVFSTDKVEADMYIVAVPTPYNSTSKRIDPTYVVESVKDILIVCKPGAIIVIESTVAPGTIDRFVRPIIRESRFTDGVDIHLAHAPERVIPGNMIYELLHNSRTIGVDDPAIGETVKNVYRSFCQGDIIITDIRTAEMTKVVENTFRDINIAFANELMKICRQSDMDVYEIIRIANMHPRVNILQPGPGVGGHCIPVDPWFLVGDYPNLAKLIWQARIVNDGMPEFVLGRISEIMEENKIFDCGRVGIYGLTYKEDVDDIRESPALQLLESMRKHLAAGIKVFDPMISKDIVPNQYHDFDKFLQDIDLLVVLVGHRHIKQNVHRVKNKIVLDTRNICGPEAYKL